MYIDPAYRGARSQSPTDLGYDRVSVADSVMTLTATLPPSDLLPFLPTTYTGGRGDASNRPRLISGSVKTAPHFMLSAAADFIMEARVRMDAGVARGYWPSFWTTTFFWPDRGEIDILEGIKNSLGALSSKMNIIGNSADGGAAEFITVAQPNYPANQWINVMAKKVGNTLFFYDDADSPGTYVLRGSTTSLVSRMTGAHDIRLDLAVANAWDGSTYNAGDWPKKVEFDWWRAWVPASAGANPALQILPAVNTTPGGSWAATFPSKTALHGSGAGLEQVSAAWDNFDAPGMPTRNNVTRLPTSMTVDLTARTVSGTVPTTEGGCMGVFITHAYADGTPASRVLLPYNVAPAVQSLAIGSYVVGAAINEVIGYTAFHSGNLGPHTYNVTAPGLTVSGNGTGTVAITGTASTSVDVTIECTNSIGQTTTVNRTLTVTAGAATLDDTFTGKADGTDLTAHTGEGGGTWSRHPTAASAKIGMAADGFVYQETADATSLYISSVATIPADAVITSVFSAKTLDNQARQLGIVGRCNPTAATFYLVRINQPAGVTRSIQLFRSVNGTLTQLGSGVTVTLTAGQTRTIALRMVGSTISVELDGSSVISVTDTNIPAAGRAGIRAYSFPGDSASAGFQLSSIVAAAA